MLTKLFLQMLSNATGLLCLQTPLFALEGVFVEQKSQDLSDKNYLSPCLSFLNTIKKGVLEW